MNKKSVGIKEAAEKLVKNIRRRTSRKYSAEEKIRIVLAGLRGEESIAALCRREDCGKPLLQMVERVSRGRKAPAVWRHRTSGHVT